MTVKILKNQSGSTLQIINREIAHGDEYNVPKILWLNASEDETVAALISSGDVIVNDGEEDLSIADGLRHVSNIDGMTWAQDVDFDNSENGFASSNAQDAILEAKSSALYYHVRNTSQQDTTSGTFATMTGMSLTPVSGKYIAILEADCEVIGVNGAGEIGIFLDGVQVANSSRTIQNTITGLISIGSNNIRSNVVSICEVTCNGSQAVTGRFRELDNDTLRAIGKSLTLIRVGNV